MNASSLEPPALVVVAVAPGPGAAEPWVQRVLESAGAPVTLAVAPVGELGAHDGDVVLIDREVALPDGWLVALRTVPDGVPCATVSCLSVEAREPAELRRIGEGMAALGGPVAAERPLPGCVLLRRSAIVLLSPADLETFADRCVAHGLVHLVSDRMVAGGGSEDGDPDERTAAGHALAWARRVEHGLSVTIDARSLVGDGAGTQVHTLELIAAVAGRPGLRLRVVLPPVPAPEALVVLRGLGGVELCSYDDVVNSGVRTDVVHRPYQVFTEHDLRLLRRLGHRIVITHQDQLLYRNEGYFDDPLDWRDYRGVCRLALAAADRVVFFSEHARREALRDELIEAPRCAVIPIGSDHGPITPPIEPSRPSAVADDAPFLLVLGTDLAHKNRPFAIRLLRALRDQHGWPGGLVLAGPHADRGSSRAHEEHELEGGSLPVTTLGRVGPSERAWLLTHCSAVVFPSTEEGFGLLPFEAGLAGRPCLFASVSAMAELLPAEAATLEPWDPVRSAARAIGLLEPGEERDRHVGLLRGAAEGLSWARTAERLAELYDRVLREPPRAISQIAADELDRHAEYIAFRKSFGDDAIALVGPSGYLPPDIQRPLLAAAAKPLVRRPLFGLLRLLYRVGRRDG